MNCPKCGFEQPDGGVECARCGIIFSRFRGSAPAVEAPVPPPPIQPGAPQSLPLSSSEPFFAPPPPAPAPPPAYSGQAAEPPPPRDETPNPFWASLPDRVSYNTTTKGKRGRLCPYQFASQGFREFQVPFKPDPFTYRRVPNWRRSCSSVR